MKPVGPPWLLGVEIGGTKLQVGLGKGDGVIAQLRRSRIDPAAGAAGILTQIERDVEMALSLQEISISAVGAIGFGFGGPVNASAGTLVKSNHVGGWDGFDLCGWAKSRFHVPVAVVHNDADTAALGESRFGAGRGKNPLLYVTIGSGIGAGLVLDGRIYRGSGLGALELGHLWVRPPDVNGPGETVEQAASGWSIGRRAREAASCEPGRAATMLDLVDGQPDQLDAEAVALAAGLGDPTAIEVLNHARYALAMGLAHAVTLLAPARIILGGGVSIMGESLWFDPIRAQLDFWVFEPFRKSFDVVPAQLGEEVVVHGALAMAQDAALEAPESV